MHSRSICFLRKCISIITQNLRWVIPKRPHHTFSFVPCRTFDFVNYYFEAMSNYNDPDSHMFSVYFGEQVSFGCFVLVLAYIGTEPFVY